MKLPKELKFSELLMQPQSVLLSPLLDIPRAQKPGSATTQGIALILGSPAAVESLIKQPISLGHPKRTARALGEQVKTTKTVVGN